MTSSDSKAGSPSILFSQLPGLLVRQPVLIEHLSRCREQEPGCERRESFKLDAPHASNRSDSSSSSSADTASQGSGSAEAPEQHQQQQLQLPARQLVQVRSYNRTDTGAHSKSAVA
ncbi:hypothetical protein EVAR_82070_1 [Eumeta japonica]|uniref:Uncharacterized protein n=1 Tax=Eumeta variegata TaxID=151549 RepID=A0A4C1U221_EUMVA|nr:hypothetical protein EVAR_82070_1 [Eumeta japonica]